MEYGLEYVDCLGLNMYFGGSYGKESACNAGDPGSIPGSGRSPGEGNGNPLQCSCWEIPWTEEPGGLQSTGLQRVGHDSSDLAHMHTAFSKIIFFQMKERNPVQKISY